MERWIYWGFLIAGTLFAFLVLPFRMFLFIAIIALIELVYGNFRKRHTVRNY